MIYRFQIELAPDQWLDIGSAHGSGPHPVGAAIHDLLKSRDGSLRAGTYRYRPIDRVTHEWSLLTLDSNLGAGREAA
jgi:hypothetical protein